MRTVRVERDLPGDPTFVFDWFVTPELLVRWWPSEAETEPHAGGSYRLYWDGPDVTLRGEYTEVEPGTLLRFSWSWDHEALAPRAVDVAFERTDRGTQVVVVQEADSDDEAADYVDGWTHFLGKLAEEIGRG